VFHVIHEIFDECPLSVGIPDDDVEFCPEGRFLNIEAGSVAYTHKFMTIFDYY